MGTVPGQTVGNTLEVVVAALLFRRLAVCRIGLERVWDVFALLMCAAVGTLISATFGVVSLRLGDVITGNARPGPGPRARAALLRSARRGSGSV